ncbi:hypothetical protein BCV69DRAFT_90359 [Microstroma glucosiphilum]|uniref:Phospholipid/glycerol acyltransferase domain-containing protein n=1 Tax=Pseudomicrostroma glucosiphilum TaxID=1684307 RepID=A0A316U4V2_9BASI|nr:hypothetical protein BCV69DRAFT_90359 [Pseudomicrostroma glucosiphilum]PWN17985.1 hypothetical protein BCV69DRAFT_90359 [Pseudomicrostroma glucosiphilum]
MSSSQDLKMSVAGLAPSLQASSPAAAPPPPGEDAWDAKAITISRGRGFGPWYSIMRWIGRRCSSHFFSSVTVLGGEDVPRTGAFILVCSHFSTIMDVAIISAHLPHGRPIHYWAKKGLYRGKWIAYILNDSGNIQVDRKNKDNQALFKGTFDAMQAGEAIGLFPEGGSYTEPRLHSMKAGAAWAALEYAKFLLAEEENKKDGSPASPSEIKTDVKIIPASINYTEKSRWRSQAIFQMGKAFSVDEYTDEFLAASTEPSTKIAVSATSDEDGLLGNRSDGSSRRFPAPQTPLFPATPAAYSDVEPSYLDPIVNPGAGLTVPTERPPLARGTTRRSDRAAKDAVQKLTDRISREMNQITINAPDWKTWHAMKVARELLWQGDAKKGGTELDLTHIVPISNALIALFEVDENSDSPPLPQAIHASEVLLRLQALQLAARTDLPTLNAIAPSYNKRNYSFPTKGQTSRALLYNIAQLALRSPLYVPVYIFYGPAYFAGWYMSSKHAKHEEESMASVKSLVSFPVAFLTHCLLFLFISALFLFTPPGLLIAFLLSQALRITAEKYVLSSAYRLAKETAAYGRCLTIHLGLVKSFTGREREVEVMVRAVEVAQPVQWTLTKAFKRQPDGKRARTTSQSQSQASGEAKGEVKLAMTSSVDGEVPGEKIVTLKRVRGASPGGGKRRPAPIRLLRLALQTRRESILSLRELIKAVRERGTDRQREAWMYLESQGAKLV